jgi:5-methyltetrahydropteroyltriglutamate--homocysteine methyltransferase
MIHAHVVGSMLRPKELIEAREALRQGKLTPHAFKVLEDASVDRCIATQERAGIELLTDGEQRRFLFTDSFGSSVAGIELATNEDPTEQLWHDHEGKAVKSPRATVMPTIVGKLARRNSLGTEEYAYARAQAQRPVKVTLPSPTCALIYWSQKHSTAAYPNALAALQDVAAILREEIVQLAALGCEHVQIDAPELTMAIDPASMRLFEGYGFTRASFLAEALALLGALAKDAPVEMSVHMCRGNNQGLWHTAGGYDAISKECFPRLAGYRYVLLEYDDARSGSFAALADLPRDCCAVLGLVSTKRPQLEPLELLLQRIEAASRHFPRAQLAVSPQCGFASAIFGNPVSFEIEEQKLRRVGECAARLAAGK